MSTMSSGNTLIRLQTITPSSFLIYLAHAHLYTHTHTHTVQLAKRYDHMHLSVCLCTANDNDGCVHLRVCAPASANVFMCACVI